MVLGQRPDVKCAGASTSNPGMEPSQVAGALVQVVLQLKLSGFKLLSSWQGCTSGLACWGWQDHWRARGGLDLLLGQESRPSSVLCVCLAHLHVPFHRYLGT